MLLKLVLNLYMRKVRWTFNLPDFQDRVIQGSGIRGNVGTYKTESLPNITGHSICDFLGSEQNTGAFYDIVSLETTNYYCRLSFKKFICF